MSRRLHKNVPFPSKKIQNDGNKVPIKLADLLLWSVRTRDSSNITWTNERQKEENNCLQIKCKVENKSIYLIFMNDHLILYWPYPWPQYLQVEETGSQSLRMKSLENYSLNHTRVQMWLQAHTCSCTLGIQDYGISFSSRKASKPRHISWCGMVLRENTTVVLTITWPDLAGIAGTWRFIK